MKKDGLDKKILPWEGGEAQSKIPTPGDYIRALESGLPSSERNKRWIVVCQAHIDGSGMGDIKKEPDLVLGGFLSTSEVWAKFSDAWKTVLDKQPRIDYFKLNDAFSSLKNKDSQFYGWDEKDIRARIWDLIKVIKSFPLVRVCSYINKEEFNQYIIKEPDDGRIHHPYWACFLHIIIETITDQIKHKLETPIDFIFDEEGVLGFDCAWWYNFYKNYIFPEWVLPHLGDPPSFKDDKKILPLQAADLYAGYLRRHFYDNRIIIRPFMSKELRSLQEMPEIGGPISLKFYSILMQLTNDDIRNITKKAVEIGRRVKDDMEKRRWNWLRGPSNKK